MTPSLDPPSITGRNLSPPPNDYDKQPIRGRMRPEVLQFPGRAEGAVDLSFLQQRPVTALDIAASKAPIGVVRKTRAIE
ncbi:hypothetical protein V5O48_017002 [Marasmius crinis-equi]|uniref:Uncharacterized protein n=1 Tax=Marasmius crinis-equi TaxID=585013 RepID=A0ABR3EQ71_9AGAR